MQPRAVREVFRGKLISVEVESWPAGEREIVHHPGAVGVVALTGEDVVLVRQFREPVRGELLEIPAGIMDIEGENPEDAAARELREETGWRAGSVERLGVIHTSPGFTDERIELFLARAEEHGDPERGIEVVRMPFQEALSAVRDGRITDAKTAVALLLAATA